MVELSMINEIRELVRALLTIRPVNESEKNDRDQIGDIILSELGRLEGMIDKSKTIPADMVYSIWDISTDTGEYPEYVVEWRKIAKKFGFNVSKK